MYRQSISKLLRKNNFYSKVLAPLIQNVAEKKMEGAVKISAGCSSGKPDLDVVSQVHIGAELLTVSDSTANLSKFKKLFRAMEGFPSLTQCL